MTVHVKICRIDPRARVPAYAKPGDSGMDLSALEDVMLVPGVPTYIDTGIAVAVPEGYESQVRPRSSFSRRGIVTSFGTCDAGYRGSIGVILTLQKLTQAGPVFEVNATLPVEIKAGERIAQLVIAPVTRAALDVVSSVEELGETERGAGGWGSTGRGV